MNHCMTISSDDVLWDYYIEKLPKKKQDIYYRKKYYSLNEAITSGEAELFVYEEDDNLGVYPYIKRKIDLLTDEYPYYDIETAYGYGGPILKNELPEFIDHFEAAFLEYCISENIVAEFIRFHPILNNSKTFRKNINVIHNRLTVWVDLRKSLDEIWMEDISKQNRNIIRKCIKNGLVVKVSENYDQFFELYNQTMQKVGAEEFYYFNTEYFENIKKDSDYILMEVSRNDEVLAGAIFIKYKNYFHYHLSGSKIESLKLSPNNLLLWEAIQFAKLNGCKKMHFGGGLTDSKEDTLFQFKRKFSSEYADFYIGTRVHNQQIYQNLIKDWELKHGESAKILLQYRK